MSAATQLGPNLVLILTSLETQRPPYVLEHHIRVFPALHHRHCRQQRVGDRNNPPPPHLATW